MAILVSVDRASSLPNTTRNNRLTKELKTNQNQNLAKMKLRFQALAYTAMGMVPLAASQNSQCTDVNGDVVGDSGKIVTKDSIDRVLFQRKGGNNCGCSYVSH